MATPDSLSDEIEPEEFGSGTRESGEVALWIVDARKGHGASFGHLAERCRQYLLLVANRELDAGLRSKVGASDLVQETLLTAQQIFARFTGTSEQDLRLWLRRILLNTIAHASRSYRQAGKRNIEREQQLFGHGSEDWLDLVDQASTPRANAIANEQALAIEQAIDRLPEHYRQVISERCFERRTFVEIGQRMDLSGDAARRLWCRAVERLRREWEAGDESR